ncbi:MAG: hypothetical protein R3C97_16870 [Geminicoccaceae bacterium]
MEVVSLLPGFIRIMVEAIDVLLNLAKSNGTFNKREQRVADFVQATTPTRPLLMRQSEIAEAADVSVRPSIASARRSDAVDFAISRSGWPEASL